MLPLVPAVQLSLLQNQQKVLAIDPHPVGDQVVVGDEMMLVGVVPEPADVLDQFAVVVNERIVHGDLAILAAPGGGVLQEPGQRAGIWLVSTGNEQGHVVMGVAVGDPLARDQEPPSG